MNSRCLPLMLLFVPGLAHAWPNGQRTLSRTIFCGLVSDYDYPLTKLKKGDRATVTFVPGSTQGYRREAGVTNPTNLTLKAALFSGRANSVSDRSLFLFWSPQVRDVKHLGYRLCLSYPSDATPSPDVWPIGIHELDVAFGPAVRNSSGLQYDDSAILSQLPRGL